MPVYWQPAILDQLLHQYFPPLIRFPITLLQPLDTNTVNLLSMFGRNITDVTSGADTPSVTNLPNGIRSQWRLVSDV